MSLCELGCPNLDYVYNMPWREYLIRLYAYKRQQKRLDYRQRDIMYQIYVGTWQNHKKKPMSIDRYWDIEGRKENDIKAKWEHFRKLKEKNG